MNVFSALIKCTSIGFLVGFLASDGPDLGNSLLPLAGLMVFISIILVLFELTNLEPVTTVPAKSV
jgi:hypothetical protein